MRVWPERRMSCRVTMVVEFGASSGLWAPRDAVMKELLQTRLQLLNVWREANEWGGSGSDDKDQ